MEAKEKAIELINKYNFLNYKTDLSIHEKKECALIVVDNILDAICFNMCDEDEWNKENEYWEEVIKEIKKI
jgi:hypothetical protein